MTDLLAYLKANRYPGRGIFVGLTEDGTKAVTAYFIMGRSENSRNRIFVMQEGTLYTQAYDLSKVTDPTLIIYPAFRSLGKKDIVTNGVQTDIFFMGLQCRKNFLYGLEQQTYEPDYPNCTPRISAVLSYDQDFSYQMSIVKKGEENSTKRYLFCYEGVPNVGHIIHTYQSDGNPLPSFSGEPVAVSVPNDVKTFSQKIWNALDGENKISLFVRAYSLADGRAENIIINKNK